MPGSAVCEHLPALERCIALPPPQRILDADGAKLRAVAGGRADLGVRRAWPPSGRSHAIPRRPAVFCPPGTDDGGAGAGAAREKNAGGSAIRVRGFAAAVAALGLHLHLYGDAVE